MNFHIEELELEHLPNNMPDFVEKMTVTNIGLWLKQIDEEIELTIDFKISPEESDEILCVKFDLDGDIEKISWES